MAQTQPQTAAAPDVAPFAPATNSAAAPASPSASALQMFTPTLPVYLNITLDRAVMTVDETAVVTVSLYSTGDLTKKQLKLVLDVPNTLITTTGGKGKLRWDVPNLSAGQIFQQQVLVRVDKVKKALKQGVVRFTATSNAVGHKALMTEKLLGIVPATSVTDGTQSADGAVLRDVDRGITLLMPPDATTLGVALHYKARFRAPRRKGVKPVTAPVQGANTPLTDAQALTATLNNTATLAGLPFANQPLTNTLYLPLVDQVGLSEGVTTGPTEADLTASAAPTTSVGITTLVPITDHGVNVYQMWQFDAIQATQPITQFNEPLLLLISADWLVQAGIDPAQMDLWTREQDTDEWQALRMEYDPVRQQYSAWLTHFSTYTIGDGLNTRGEVLPTTEGFNSERLTGVATVHYPIETPKGLGGLSPNLSIDYSSSVVDDFLFDVGDDDYDNQASWVGYGWNVSGLSYIDRAEVGTPSNTSGFYTMILNGSRSNINGGRSGGAFLDSDYFTKIKSVQDATFNGWEATTTDGMLYRFGGPDLAESWPSGQRGMNTPISKYLYTGKKHIFDKWYLSEVRDPLGNRMTFTYQAQRGEILNWKNCNTGYSGNNDEDNVWYTRSTRPVEIDWGYTDVGNDTATMRVIFEYSDDSRPDYRVPGFDVDCRQPYYSRKRLLAIKVQVKDKNALADTDQDNDWHTLHRYAFTYLEGSDSAYPCSGAACKRPGADERHMLLQQIDHYGKGGVGVPITSYKFTYYADNASIPGRYAGYTTNNVRLQTADNSLGGKVQFTYTPKFLDSTQCPDTVCTVTNQGDEKRWRFPVTRTTINDGLGSQIVTDYAYQNPAMRGEYNQYGTLAAGEFLGFKDSNARHFEIVPEGTAPDQEVQYEEMTFWRAAPSSATATQPRDPRTGKMQLHTIWGKPLPSGTKCPGGEILTANDQRCLLANSTQTWSAYRLTNGVWNPWANEQTGPFWVRKDEESEVKDGVTNGAKYLYYKAQQNGQQFGNVTQVKEYTEKGFLRTTVTEYFPNVDANIVNKPARVRVYEGDFDAANPLKNCLAETRTIYDNLEGDYNSLPSQGLVAKTQQAITACSNTTTIEMYDVNWQETRMAYYKYGNQKVLHHVGTSATDGNDWLHTEYDDYYHLFPIRQWKGQNSNFAETAMYYGVNGLGVNDPKAFWGAQQSHCAVNDVCVRQSYDNFGRPINRWDYVLKGSDWETTTLASVLWGYENPNMNKDFKTTIVNEWHAPRCTGNFVRKHYNGLGQLVVEQKPEQDWAVTIDNCKPTTKTDEIQTLYAYNALGQQSRASIPYTVAPIPDDAEGWAHRIADIKWDTVWESITNTVTSYDTLGRPTQTTAPNGEVTLFKYEKRISKVYTQDRNKTASTADAYRINQWQEVDGLGYVANTRTGSYNSDGTWTENASVNFTHDATGNLLSVTHPNGIGATTMTYDLLGHKKTMNDVDMGSWRYTYDRQGKLATQTDACGNVTTLLYENVLAQVTDKLFQKGTACPSVVAPQYNISFLYGDTGVKRGQLIQVRYTDGSYQKDIDYNNLGLLLSETVKIEGAPQSYTTYHGYDAYQRPDRLIYPDGEQIFTAYNSLGLPNLLGRPKGYGTLVDSVNYDEAGRLTQMRFPLGNNLYRTQKYDAFDLQTSDAGQLTAIRVGTSNDLNNPASWSNTWQNYNYDSFGNLIALNDQGTNYNFTYDAQNRLKDSYGRSYMYDAAGRLTNYEQTGLAANPDTPHAMASDWTRYALDLNGNYTARLQGNGQQAFTWTTDNHLQRVTWAGGEESYLYDADGQRLKKSNRYGDVTFYPFPHYEVTNEVAWVDDAIPGGATVVADNDSWGWENGNPVSGASYHRSEPKAGLHQHYFYGAAQPLKVNTGDTLYAYVYLDPSNPPSELMLQWYDSSSGWEHRAYWGQNLIGFGAEGTASRRSMGALPATGGWVRLEVPAAQVGLEGINVTGMAFTLYNGQASWDRAGKRSATWLATKYYAFNGQRIAMSDETGLYYLHADRLGSTMAVTNESGNTIADHGYYAYGRDRRGSELRTAQRFTGQQSDASGLIYMNARYYDPQIGQFISPDTLVPDATNVFDYNRYMYARGNPMKYNDPSGHCLAIAGGLVADAGTGGLAVVLTPLEVGVDAACWATVGMLVTNLAAQWGDKLPGAVDWMFSSTDEQAAHSAGQNAGNSATGGPDDPWNRFRKSGMSEGRIRGIQAAARQGTISVEKAYGQFTDLLGRGITASDHALIEAQEEKISTQRIADTFTGAARNTQYYLGDPGRVVQWSPYTKVAVVIDQATKELVSVYVRTAEQGSWQAMNAFDIIKWKTFMAIK